MIKGDTFNKEIKRLRKEYLIPEQGFEANYQYNELPNELISEIADLYHQYDLGPEWAEVITKYLFTNILEEPSNVKDVCTIEYNPIPTHDLILIGGEKPTKKYEHPIRLSINSHASQNQIIDYIKRNYTSRIKPLQKIEQEKTIKLKIYRGSSFIQKRNEYIWNLHTEKHLSNKKIFSMLPKEYKEKLDQGSIGKIISLEKELRKEL